MGTNTQSLKPADTRTYQTLLLLAWRNVLFFAFFVGFTMYQINWYMAVQASVPIAEKGDWTLGCLLLIVYIPSLIVLVSCLPFAQTTTRGTQIETFSRDFNRLIICIVTRGTNVEASQRGWEAMRHLKYLDTRIQIVLLTDEGYDKSIDDIGIPVKATPKLFVPSKALYKARALEWFRIHMNLRDDDWVLHLDEETIVDSHAVTECMAFIHHNLNLDYGQGMIFYNSPPYYWAYPLLTFADTVRIKDDVFGKYYLAFQCLHYPIAGAHGSFLLTSGKMENTVGWNTENIAEDSWFAFSGHDNGFRGGWIRSIAREQSPQTILDFLKQRRRWVHGLWRCSGLWGKANCVHMVISAITPLVLSILSFVNYPIKLPLWALATMIAITSLDRAALFLALLIQDVDAGVSMGRVVLHMCLLPFASFSNLFLEWASVVYAFAIPPKGYHIIKK